MSNNIHINLLIFIILVIIPYGIEYSENYNILINRPDASLVLLFHHIGSAYIYFGSILFGFYKFHILVCLFVLVMWIKSKFNCVITEMYNKMININPNDKLKDITYYISKITEIQYLHIFVLIGVLFYDVDNIFKSIAIKHGKLN